LYVGVNPYKNETIVIAAVALIEEMKRVQEEEAFIYSNARQTTA
jgi:hypothetical protein